MDHEAALDRLHARNPHAFELAKLASLAVQVEPELLRDLRMLIPDADPGAEADLWLSDLVDSKGPLGMEMVPGVRAKLQEKLRADGDALERAAKVIARAHAGLSEVVRIEEEVTFRALKGDIDEDRLETLLAPIIARLDYDAHAGLARWAIRAFEEMPPSVRDSDVVWHLLRASGVARAASEESTERRQVHEIPRVRVALQLRGDMLEIDTAPDIDVQSQFLRGDFLHWIDLPATNPLMLEISSGHGSKRIIQRIVLAPGDQFHQPLAADSVRVRTLADETYWLVSKVAPDDWAILLGSPENVERKEASQFLEWLHSPFGGRIAASNTITVDTLADVLGMAQHSIRTRCRRLYLHYEAPPLRDSALYLLSSVMAALKSLTTELVVVVDSFLDGGKHFSTAGVAQIADGIQGSTLAIFRVGVREERTFTERVVDGLRGLAQNTNGEVTAESLKRYLVTGNEGRSGLPGVSVWLGVNFRLCEVESLASGSSSSEFHGLTVMLSRIKKRPAIRGAVPAGVVRPFRGQFVIVAGSGDETLSRSEELVIEPLAAELAKAGYGVIVGGWPGVDAAMADAFARQLRARGESVEARLLQYVSTSFAPVSDEGTLVEVEDDLEAALSVAFALVLIGGRGGALDYARRAAERGLRILPIHQTGRDAARFAPLAGDRLGEQEGTITSAEEAMEIVDRLIEELRAPAAVSDASTEPSPPPEKSPLVFISHTRENREEVEALMSTLRERGIDVWDAQERINPGEEWVKAITRAIRTVDYVIVVQSPELSGRDESYAYAEIREALERERGMPRHQRFLISVRIRDAVLLDDLAKYHVIDIDTRAGQELVADLILEDSRDVRA